MKLLLLFFVLIQGYGKVESASPWDAFLSVVGDFTNVMKNKFEGAKQGVKNLINQIFHLKKVVKVNVIKIVDPYNNTTPGYYYPQSYFDNDNFTSEINTYLPTDALIREHRKLCTIHTLYTEDGYQLVLHRLINPIRIRGIKETILFHHGLLGSSADWILLGPEKALPYYLATLGYDVWFANARGNRYSQGHQNSTNITNYWDFSWQEIGLYDLPAIMEYVKDKTKEPINFIGHSMGATALLALLSSIPKYNEYLRMAILLGPLVYMRNIKGPLRMLSLMTETQPQELFEILGRAHFMPSRTLPEEFMKRFCLDEVLFCGNPLFFLSGVPRNHSNWDKNFTKLLFQHIPAGGSTKTLLHYSQLIKSGKFHKFGDVNDEFSLKEVTTPIALISSSDDWLATIPDLVRLYINIFNPIEHYIIRDRNVSHTDFVWGEDAYKLVFPKVIELLQSSSQVLGKQENEV